LVPETAIEDTDKTGTAVPPLPVPPIVTVGSEVNEPPLPAIDESPTRADPVPGVLPVGNVTPGIEPVYDPPVVIVPTAVPVTRPSAAVAVAAPGPPAVWVPPLTFTVGTEVYPVPPALTVTALRPALACAAPAVVSVPLVNPPTEGTAV
jgi:hypothetical protein